ncbi:MAG: SusD/RagB family nutrient-binding outer membrane lipoprotein [Algoriphagus sp.]|nr:SusD/RagB family nutrient-binding outer membrane lipoprotein [Algoriphagus sp.]
MNKTYINRITFSFLLVFLLLAGSCTEGFEEINENPNAPEQIGPSFLLSNVISVAADKNTYDQGFRLANYLAQFAASVEFERIDRYEMGSNAQYWNGTYRLINDLESIKKSPGTNEAYQAVADILRAYLFSQLTDMWGDVPYKDALKAGEGNFAPAYDTQEFIYTDPQQGILATLRKANETLSTTNARIQGDMMFANDLEKWRRFANSLRFRLLLRISKRLSDFSEMQQLADSGDMMRGNADNAVVPYLVSAPNQWPMSQAALGLYQEHRMTLTVDSVLRLWNDPRQNVLYKPTAASVTAGNPQFKGLQNGLNRETINMQAINLNDISLFGGIFRDVPNGVDGQFMQFSELQFSLAEAVERGYIQGNAKENYEAGIRAHFQYLRVELPPTYLSQISIALNGDKNMEKILTQKWLSLINNGHEAWFQVRRTGIPSLKPGPDNLNEGRYPVRYFYPESEQAVNRENYQEAVARMGDDDINTKVWWEK